MTGGKDVTIAATQKDATTDADGVAEVVVASAAGAVNVAYTGKYADGANNTLNNISVTGGTTVNVDVNTGITAAQSNAAVNDTTNFTLTQSDVAVTGGASTTEVTITQDAAVAENDTAGKGAIGVNNGAVTITDGNATTASDTITTVTLANFDNSTINSTVLSTLNLTGGSTAALASGTLDLAQTAADKSTAATTLSLNMAGGFVGTISGTQADVYETVNIASAADATIADIEMDALTTLNVSGDGKTTLTALTDTENAALTAITSTGGGLKIGTELATDVAVTGGAGVEDIMIGATTKTIDLGAGDDVVTVSTTTMGAGGAVKGGEGTDTLVANTNTSAFSGLPAFTGFETLRIAGTAAEGAHNAVGFTALELGATKAAVSSFTNVADGVGLTVLASLNGAHTVTLADATGTTAGGDAESFDLTLSSAGALDANTNGITINGVETFNITTTDTDTTAHTNKLALTADAAESIVVTGNTGLDLTNAVATKVTNFDASGVTGSADDAAALAVTYVSGYNTVGGVATIKGGSGNDSLTGGVNVNDTISGNDGADTLVYTGGADSFTGGAGADTFDVNAVGTKTNYLTIEDAVAKDIIDFAGLLGLGTAANVDYTAAALKGQKVELGAAATMAQYLDAAAADNNAAAGDEVVTWFNFEGNTFLVVDNSDNTTFTEGTDALIKLTGAVDLSTSSITDGVLTIA